MATCVQSKRTRAPASYRESIALIELQKARAIFQSASMLKCVRAQPFDAVIIAFLCYLFTVALFEHEAIHFQLDRNIEYFSNID